MLKRLITSAKMFTRLHLCCLICICFLLQQANAQRTGTWVLGKTVSGVQFYHSLSTCDNHTVVLLKIVNKNKYGVKVSWNELFATQHGTDIEGSFGAKSISLTKAQTLQTTCGSTENKELLIGPGQVNPTYMAEIKKFSYADVKVSKSI